MDYLRQHYSRLETDELLKLQGTELTDQAKGALEAELQSRSGSEDAVDSDTRRRSSKKEIDFAIVAPLWRRFLAGALDFGGICALLFLVNFPVYLVASKQISDFVGYASILLFFIYTFFKDALSGQSVGKRVMRIKVLEVRTNEPCSLPRSFLRNLFIGLGVLDWVFALGAQSRRLGDLAAGTYVVKA